MSKHSYCWPLLFGVAILLSPILDRHSVSGAASLAELFAAADTTSPRLLDAKLEVARTRALQSELRAIPNPTLFGTNEELGNDDESVQERTIGVRQELGFLWTTGAQRSAAFAALAATEARLLGESKVVQTELLLKLRRLQQLNSSIQLSDTLSQRYADLLQANEAREREGDISGYDAQRVRLESIAVSNRRLALQADWQELVTQLRTETGWDTSALLAVDTESMCDLTFASKNEAVAYAEANAPELRFLEANEQAARKSTNASKLKRLPQLAIGAGQKTTNRDESGLLVEAELEIPLFNSGRSGVQLARAEQYSATRRYEIARSQLPEVVGDAFDRWQSIQSQSVATLNVSELFAHVNAALSLYMNGESSYLELLDAFQSSEELLLAAGELETARLHADLRLRELTGYPLLEDK